MNYILVIGLLLALAIKDIKDREVSVPLLACFIVVSVMTRIGIDGNIEPVILLGAVPGIVLVVLSLVSKKIGIGDGVAIIGIGLALGFMRSIVILATSLALVCLVGVVLKFIRRKKKDFGMPLIPFLFVGTTTWVLM